MTFQFIVETCHPILPIYPCTVIVGGESVEGKMVKVCIWGYQSRVPESYH
jgi:hypothetical protein